MTGVRVKWPLHLTVWLISLSYISVTILQILIYIAHNYIQWHNSFARLFTARVFASTAHEITIYTAIVLIVYHTQALNAKTIRLVAALSLKRELAAVRVHDTPELNQARSLMVRNRKNEASDIEIFAEEKADGRISVHREEVPMIQLNTPDLSQPITEPE